jgi:Tfp pilus assembly protein PilV
MRRHAGATAGFSLIEAALAGLIMATFVLAAGMTLGHGVFHRRESLKSYEALVSLRNFVAEVQAVANMPENMTAGTGVTSIYNTYHAQTFSAAGIPDGQITVTCFADEATVPPELGGPQDLNFDGDAQDNLGGLGKGTDMKLVPMRFVLDFGPYGAEQTIVVHRLVAKTVQ